MRSSVRIAAHFHDGLEHRRAEGRRKGAAIVDVARDATAIDELRPKFADLLAEDRVACLRMCAVAKVRVMQTTSEHERQSVRGGDVSRRLLEAMLRFSGVLIRQRGQA